MIIHPHSCALFNLGFRPFFLGASLYSVIIIGLWTLVYVSGAGIAISGMTPFQWHAHEMIFGYTLAVIAGFLLTAVQNWTGIKTVSGGKLAGLLGLWLMARLFFLAGSHYITLAAALDMAFIVSLLIAITVPIIQSRNWRQLGILSKLILLGLANACFYAGYLELLPEGMRLGIYGALYLVIGLVVTMGSRVIPFFIERGVASPIKLTNPRWSTVSGIMLFIIFFISELFLQQQWTGSIAAGGLFIIYSLRLAGWYTPEIWQKSLLWSLYLAFACIVTGFLFLALSALSPLPKHLGIHLFAYGGIGLMTLSMMVRVSLGHTGRSIHKPPEAVPYIFIIMLVGTFTRVFMPVINMGQYRLWVIVSQGLWIAAFSLFCIILIPILIKPRVDGNPG